MFRVCCDWSCHDNSSCSEFVVTVAHPCIFLPGNFTSWGSEGVKAFEFEFLLTHLHPCSLTFPVEPPLRVPNLGYVSPDLWAKVAYDFFCSGNSYAQVHGPDQNIADWRAATYAVSLLRQGRIDYSRLPKLDVNLKPLCCWQVGVQKGHADDLDSFSVGSLWYSWTPTEKRLMVLTVFQSLSSHGSLWYSWTPTEKQQLMVLTVFLSLFTRESVVLTDTAEKQQLTILTVSMPCVLSRESVVVMDTRRKVTTDDSTIFLCLLSHREATTDNSDPFSVFIQESVVLMDPRGEVMTDDSDRFSMSPVSQRSND